MRSPSFLSQLKRAQQRLLSLVSNLSLTKKGLILVTVPVAFELIFVGVLRETLRAADIATRRVEQSKSIIADAQALTKSFYDAGFQVIYYGLTQNLSYKENYSKVMNGLPAEIDRLAEEVKEYTPKASFDEARLAAYRGVAALRSIQAKADLGERNLFSRELRYVLDGYVRKVSDFVDRETVLAKDAPRKAEQAHDMVVICIMIGLVGNVTIGILLSYWFNILTVKRLNVLMDNTRKMVSHQSLNPPVGGGDEIGRLDQVFHQMADELDETARRKQELVSMVSHDLRTPLMSIQVSLELLSAGALGDMPLGAQKELNIAEYSASRLIQLINDLLDIDKIEAGKFDISERQTQLLPVLERAVRTVRAYAERHQIKIILPEDDTTVYADPDRLSQVVINLLSNAIKFSPPESEVRLTFDQLPKETRVNVIDRGRGIPRGEESKIFERFQQIDPKDATEKNGSGLGLAICKALIEAHHGDIGVESKEGEGSRFWFTIPKAPGTVALGRQD